MMWISKRLRHGGTESETAVDLGVATIGGEQAGVYARGEVRNLALCAPGGLAWRPKSGDRVLVLKGGPGGEEAFVLGVQGESADLADGEVELRSEAASITLRNDGAILLQGNVIINGEAYQPCQCKSGGIAEGGQG